MTVKILDFRGDGAYFLRDPALELDGLRGAPPGHVLRGAPGVPLDQRVHALLSRPCDDGRRALDVVFAAPKPVSVLLATEPPRVARQLVALHEQSVADAFDYLAARDDAGAAADLGAVGFTHGVNRLLDPHLHTHVLVGARDDHDAPLDARRLRWRCAAADAVYVAALRDGLPGVTGRSSWVGRSGGTFVEGVDLALVAASSSPRRRDGRVEHGEPKRHPTRAEVVARWSALRASSGSAGDELAPPPRRGSIDEHRFARELGEGLVGRGDVVRAWGRACTFGAPAAAVVAAAGLVAPQLDGGARRAAVSIRDDVGTKVLGPRPIDLAALGRWRDDRDALGRYLADGHRLSHLLDGRGAPAATRLAIARFDVARSAHVEHRGLRRAVVRDVADGRGLS